MQQQAAQSEYESTTNAPRQAFEMFMRMREAQERSHANATVTAVEQAKLVEYNNRNAVFNMELDTRMKVAQVKLAEAEASKRREEQAAEREKMNVPSSMMGKPFEVNGKVYKPMPGFGGERQIQLIEVDGDELADFHAERDAVIAGARSRAAEHEARAASLRQGGRHSSKDKWDIETIKAKMREAVAFASNDVRAETERRIKELETEEQGQEARPVGYGNQSSDTDEAATAALRNISTTDESLAKFEKDAGSSERAHAAIVAAARDFASYSQGMTLREALLMVLDRMKNDPDYRSAVMGKAKGK